MTGAPDRAFFEIAAQLIPLFFLLILVENRLRLPAQEGESERPLRGFMARMGLLAAVVIGEAAALVAVAGQPTEFEAAIVAQVLGILGVYILAPPVMREIEEVRAHVHSRAIKHLLVTIATFVVTLPLLAGTVMALR